MGVDPGGFALAISVESVEADLDPFAEADGFDVVDGDAVFQSVSGEVRAEGQTASGRESPEMHDDAAADIGANDGPADRRAWCRRVRGSGRP